jgi:hypothetical protein
MDNEFWIVIFIRTTTVYEASCSANSESSANRKLSSDAVCLVVLCEVCERKTSDFRPSKLPPLSTLYRAVRCDVFYEVFSSLLERLGRVDFYFAGKRCQLNRSMQHQLIS